MIMLKKNSDSKNAPPGIFSNSWGITINVRPVLPAPRDSKATSAESVRANTVGITAKAAKRDAALFPKPAIKEFNTISSFLFI